MNQNCKFGMNCLNPKCSFQHNLQKVNIPCIHYSRGACFKGKHCPYLHTGAKGTPTPFQQYVKPLNKPESQTKTQESAEEPNFILENTEQKPETSEQSKEDAVNIHIPAEDIIMENTQQPEESTTSMIHNPKPEVTQQPEEPVFIDKPQETIYQPINEDNQPINEDIQPTSEDMELIIQDKQPISEDIQPIIQDKQPIIQDKQPISEDIQPNIQDKQPICENIQPIVQDKQPIVQDKHPIAQGKVSQPLKLDTTPEKVPQKPMKKTKSNQKSKESQISKTVELHDTTPVKPSTIKVKTLDEILKEKKEKELKKKEQQDKELKATKPTVLPQTSKDLKPQPVALQRVSTGEKRKPTEALEDLTVKKARTNQELKQEIPDHQPLTLHEDIPKLTSQTAFTFSALEKPTQEMQIDIQSTPIIPISTVSESMDIDILPTSTDQQADLSTITTSQLPEPSLALPSVQTASEPKQLEEAHKQSPQTLIKRKRSSEDSQKLKPVDKSIVMVGSKPVVSKSENKKITLPAIQKKPVGVKILTIEEIKAKKQHKKAQGVSQEKPIKRPKPSPINITAQDWENYSKVLQSLDFSEIPQETLSPTALEERKEIAQKMSTVEGLEAIILQLESKVNEMEQRTSTDKLLQEEPNFNTLSIQDKIDVIYNQMKTIHI